MLVSQWNMILSIEMWTVMSTMSCSPQLYVIYDAAAVPPRPEDGTVSVIVLFTVVSSCVTDCNF